jgi:hypothetical protein
MRFSKAVTVVAIAAMAVPSTAMASSPGSGPTLSGSIESTQGGANNTTTQYKIEYVDSVFGPVSCAGVHKSGKNWPGNGRDSFACTSTTGNPLPGVTPGEVLIIAPGEWESDYFALLRPAQFPPRNTQPFNLTVSSDGMSFSASALYF